MFSVSSQLGHSSVCLRDIRVGNQRVICDPQSQTVDLLTFHNASQDALLISPPDQSCGPSCFADTTTQAVAEPNLWDTFPPSTVGGNTVFGINGGTSEPRQFFTATASPSGFGGQTFATFTSSGGSSFTFSSPSDGSQPVGTSWTPPVIRLGTFPGFTQIAGVPTTTPPIFTRPVSGSFITEEPATTSTPPASTLGAFSLVPLFTPSPISPSTDIVTFPTTTDIAVSSEEPAQPLFTFPNVIYTPTPADTTISPSTLEPDIVSAPVTDEADLPGFENVSSNATLPIDNQTTTQKPAVRIVSIPSTSFPATTTDNPGSTSTTIPTEDAADMTPATTLKDPCLPNPCQNGGLCWPLNLPDGGSDFKCSCTQGYHGSTCALDTCRDAVTNATVCLNGGQCMVNETTGSPDCTCARGFMPPYCKHRDPCLGTVRCENGGTCMPYDNGNGMTWE